MSVFIGIPQKRTSEVDLVKPLGQQLTTLYGSNVDYEKDLESLDKLRKEATFKGIDGKVTSTLSALQKYYDQLKLFSEKCPNDDVPINFKWKDSFEKTSYTFIPSSSTSQIIQLLSYERLCVLFNIGASYSEIAAALVNEDVHNEHALQMAVKNFQIAAGIFSNLKTEVPASLGSRCNHVDLNPNVLNVLQLIMLAQAQEAICIKASSMSDVSLSKIASQCSDYYNECYKLIQVNKNIWPSKEWTNHIHARHLVYMGISDFHQSAVALASKKYGDEISRLKHAVECFQQAELLTPQPEHIQQYVKKASRRCEEAIKENDFIYHARIPEYRLLDLIERFSLVNIAPVAQKFAPDSADLFSDLMPIKFQQAWQKFDARRQEIVSKELAGLQEATANLNAILASLNLPASLEDAPGVDLPQSLKDKSKYVRQKGGINHITRLIDELPDLLRRNKEILNEIERSLKKEEAQDDAGREKYGKKKWSRQPSRVLNKAWKEYVDKYHTTIRNAMDADEKVKRKFKDHETEISLLSNESLEAIRDAIPSGYQGNNYSNAPCVSRLRKLMQDVGDLKQSRQDLENKFKNLDLTQIKKRFEDASKNQVVPFDDNAMIAEVMGEVFGPLEKRARESREQQDALIKEIQCANEDFLDIRGQSDSSAHTRDDFFRRLASAHDAFNDLLRHLQEGTKFYNDLTEILVNVQTKVDDFCASRKIEHDEYVKSFGDTPAKEVEKPPPASVAPASAPPASGGGEQMSQQVPYFPPPPLPTMPYGYGTYHPGAYPMQAHPGYAPGYPYPGYHTLPYSHPQQQPPK